MEHTKFTYIVGVSLLVLLVLVVYIGSRIQGVELGLADVDNRLSSIEGVLGTSQSTSYYPDDSYNATVYDSFGGDEYDPYASYDDGSYGYDSGYDYATE